MVRRRGDTEEQILAALRHAEGGTDQPQVVRAPFKFLHADTLIDAKVLGQVAATPAHYAGVAYCGVGANLP